MRFDLEECTLTGLRISATDNAGHYCTFSPTPRLGMWRGEIVQWWQCSLCVQGSWRKLEEIESTQKGGGE